MHKKIQTNHINTMKKIVLLIWIIVIFYLSSQPAKLSNNLSINVSSIIFNNISLNDFLRNMMHMMEFLVLGIFMINTSKRKNYLLIFTLCVFLACSDEIFQVFIDGRTCELKDVLLDTTGAFLGITSYHLINKIKELAIA